MPESAVLEKTAMLTAKQPEHTSRGENTGVRAAESVDERASTLDRVIKSRGDIHISGETKPIQCGYDFYAGAFGLIMVSVKEPGSFYKVSVSNVDEQWEEDSSFSSRNTLVLETEALKELEYLGVCGVPRVNAVGVNSDGEVWAGMECIKEGLSLKSVWKKLHPVQLTDALIKAARIHKNINDAGWYHGEVTPKNILINGDGEVAVIDFGNAIKLTESAENEAGEFAYSIKEMVTRCAEGANERYKASYIELKVLKGSNWDQVIRGLQRARKRFELDFGEPGELDLTKCVGDGLLISDSVVMKKTGTRNTCEMTGLRINYIDVDQLETALNGVVKNMKTFGPKEMSVVSWLRRDNLVIEIKGATSAVLPEELDGKEVFSGTNLRASMGDLYGKYGEELRDIFDAASRVMPENFDYSKQPGIKWMSTKDKLGRSAVAIELKIPLPVFMESAELAEALLSTL